MRREGHGRDAASTFGNYSAQVMFWGIGGALCKPAEIVSGKGILAMEQGLESGRPAHDLHPDFLMNPFREILCFCHLFPRLTFRF
jgi:hypothetical protein